MASKFNKSKFEDLLYEGKVIEDSGWDEEYFFFCFDWWEWDKVRISELSGCTTEVAVEIIRTTVLFKC